MGVERLRKMLEIQTGIITGEMSPSVQKRAEKLQISELHLGIKDKQKCLTEILEIHHLLPENIAYIGDDVNDLPVLPLIGIFFCPADALPQVREAADVVLALNGGAGCFREMAEMIIAVKQQIS